MKCTVRIACCLLTLCLPLESAWSQVSVGGNGGGTRASGGGAGSRPAGGLSSPPDRPEPDPGCDTGGGLPGAPAPRALDGARRCAPRPWVATGAPVMGTAATPIALPSGPAATSWQRWWAHNKDAYLDLRRNLDARVLTGSDTYFLGHGDTSLGRDLRRPSREEIASRVVPVLARTLASESDPALLQRSMIALAKIGGSRDTGLVRSLHEHLDHPNQGVAESAVLSLGILAEEAAVPTLIALLEDTREGWILADRVNVPTRTRAFAAYSLGLIGARSDDLDFKREIVARLVRILEQPHFASRDIKIAAMTAFGLMPLPVDHSTQVALDSGHSFSGRVTSRQGQLHFLEHYFAPEHQRANASTRHWLVRSHAPTAMARLCEGAPQLLRERVAERLIEGFGPHSREQREVQQSCILALGRIGDADAQDPLDLRIRAELTRAIDDGDEVSRRFALIALARAGSRRGASDQPWAGLDQTNEVLLAQLTRGENGLRPWAALALGVQGHALLAQGQVPRPRSLEALRAACEDSRRPEECGAFMIALGLQGDHLSSELLLEKLELFSGSDGARGDGAVALGLMSDAGATEVVHAMLERSLHRPELLSRSAIALGLLGDRKLVPELIKQLAAASSAMVQSSVASALGYIGDARSIEPLVGLVENERARNGARAWAAVALGRVCDREPLPWPSILAADLNYNAAPATLSEQVSRSGVLDQF